MAGSGLSSLKLLVFFGIQVLLSLNSTNLSPNCKPHVTIPSRESFPRFPFPSISTTTSINFLHHLNQLIPPIQSAWQNLKLRIWTFYFFFVLPAVLLLLHMALPFLLLLFHLSTSHLATSYFSSSSLKASAQGSEPSTSSRESNQILSHIALFFGSLQIRDVTQRKCELSVDVNLTKFMFNLHKWCQVVLENRLVLLVTLLSAKRADLHMASSHFVNQKST